MAMALVLGATGHIGAHIVRALLAEGHTVRAAYRNPRMLWMLEELPVERALVDIETLEGLPAALQGCDWVFHAAGYYPRRGQSRQACVDRGASSTRRLLEAVAAARPQRLVFTSSAATIAHRPDRPSTELDVEPWPAAPPRSLYATVKIAMEQEALRAARDGLPVVIVNPSICLGEYDAHQLSGRLILAYAKYRVPWYADYTFNGVYTGDVGVGHVRAAARGRCGERYLLTGHTMTLQAFSGIVARILGRRPAWWKLPSWVFNIVAPGVRRMQRLDGSKAVRELGVPQTSLDVAVERAIRWFRQYGYL
ncbi:MAG: hypothetical protein COV75_05340 [Candidatus Omnitrophica bacterium CG11_big_fil_rev_8_21_14_0_20_63_9]|nr:MAG: hypothetical protein COV75_05340 [Candidatus Omnitrophica bacterium CG11_big_fil_rev_8_21_14_0_20_63_9]